MLQRYSRDPDQHARSRKAQPWPGKRNRVPEVVFSPRTNILFSESYRSKKVRIFGLAYAQAFDITEVQIAKQPNITMALKTKFVGTSSSGDLKEAIQNALKEARKEFDKSLKWEIVKIAENQLTLGPISVVIRVGGGKGDGGVGPKKPG
jgi:flavin-binding protein dodecin